MADDATDDAEDVQESTDPDAGGESDAGSDGDGEEKSFRERVEEIRERREKERESGERPGPEEMMGGEGGPGAPGGMGGGNPFAQMMSGMMGGGGPGGPGGMGGGPPGMGGPERGREESAGNEELVREVRQLRDEVRDITRQLQRIGDALEDD